MNFTIEHEREDDGRWLAEVPEIPGALAYGATANEAMAKAEALALRVLAERLEHDEFGPQSISIAAPLVRARGLRPRPAVFSPHSSALAGRSSASRDLIRLSPVLVGLMSCSRFTTAKRSAPRCLSELQSAPGWNPRTCERARLSPNRVSKHKKRSVLRGLH